MSNLSFRYVNLVDDATVYSYSSQLDTLPVTNLQTEILAKIWKTESGFTIKNYNRRIYFRDTATTTIWNAVLDSGTYTGSGLASALQTAMNAVGAKTDKRVLYNGTAKKFTVKRSSAVGSFKLFTNQTTSGRNDCCALITGFARGTVYSGAFAYTGTTTVGGEHHIVLDLSASSSVTAFILANHNLKSGSTIRIRLASNPAGFFGGWHDTATVTRTYTATWHSGFLAFNVTATMPRAVQLYVLDRDSTSTYAGRLFAGLHREFKFHSSAPADVTWKTKTRKYNTGVFISQGGATSFDRGAPITEYTIEIDPLDPYYNASSESLLDSLLTSTQGGKAFFLTLDPSDLNHSTVYVYVVGDIKQSRLKNTPVSTIGDLLLREQK